MNRMLGLIPLVLLLTIAACGSGAPATDDGNADATQAAADGGDSGEAGEETNGDTGNGGGASGFNLCDAISADEVSEITGAEVADTVPADLTGVLSCNYTGADGTPVAGTTLATSDAGVDPRQLFDSYAQNDEFEEIPGLGEGAVLAGDPDFPILVVMVNGSMYSLSVVADELDPAAKRDATIEMARRSIDRLP